MAILSISIPTYNRVEQLKELVESILFLVDVVSYPCYQLELADRERTF